TTAITPSACFAAAVSIATMRACACGERTYATCPMRGSATSLTYCPRPSVRRVRFGRGTDRPIYEFGRSSAVSADGLSSTIFMNAAACAEHVDAPSPLVGEGSSEFQHGRMGEG